MPAHRESYTHSMRYYETNNFGPITCINLRTYENTPPEMKYCADDINKKFYV